MAFSVTLTRKRIITSAVVLAAFIIPFVWIAGRTAADGNRGGDTDPAALANCFAIGIDAIGRGDFAGGLEQWEDGFPDDDSFVVTCFPGEHLDFVRYQLENVRLQGENRKLRKLFYG